MMLGMTGPLKINNIASTERDQADMIAVFVKINGITAAPFWRLYDGLCFTISLKAAENIFICTLIA